MIDKGGCGDVFKWYASRCECEYDKSCDVGEYLLILPGKKCIMWLYMISDLIKRCAHLVCYMYYY